MSEALAAVLVALESGCVCEMVVTLIGYRGCGKSSVGPVLAQMLGYECADSDRVIEQLAGKSIAEIFADDGEAEFRRLETDVLNDLLAQSQLVVAAGGGAILADINRERMKAAGPVIWLQATATELARRIGGDEVSGTQRPSLTGKPIENEITEVLTYRTPMYSAAATVTVDAEAGTPDEIANRLFVLLRDSAYGDSA